MCTLKAFSNIEPIKYFGLDFTKLEKYTCISHYARCFHTTQHFTPIYFYKSSIHHIFILIVSYDIIIIISFNENCSGHCI